MEKYIKVHKQFLAFLSATKSFSPYEVKMINLILANFEKIAACGTPGGKRAKLINDLIQIDPDKILSELKVGEEEQSTSERQRLVRLISIDIEKFRGFTEKCSFNLEKLYTLVYGPNGSGKSSFCESLEYVLLGFINEAEAKRIPLNEYVKNSFLANSSMPILKGVNEDGELVQIRQDYQLYNFCFIEKCRIDSFARLSSFTASNQAQLLSTIFGLDEFDEFVKEFTDNIENYISTENLKQKEYDEKSLSVNSSKQNIISYEVELKKLESERNNIALEGNLNKQFDELDLFINGSETQKGRLKCIEEELQSNNVSKSDLKRIDDLFKESEQIAKVIESFRETQRVFDERIYEINLTDLYKAVIVFENEIIDKCPVCETPFEKTDNNLGVVVNPYDNAREKLVKLKEVAIVQEKRDKAWKEVVTRKAEFISGLVDLIKGIKILNKEIGLVLPKELQHSQYNELTAHAVVLPKLEGFINELMTKKLILADCENEMDRRNKMAENAEVIRKTFMAEKEKLNNINSLIQKVKVNETTFAGLLEKAKLVVSNFNLTQAVLLKGIEDEKKNIERNKQFISAYKSFKQRLVTYKERLPLQLVIDLNDLTREFYNFINQDDEKFELLHTVKLPIKPNEVIQVSFQDSPTKFVNALQVLSDGHIKCLGLSILLAKSINSGSSFMIFDDIVNAIDDDHRGRIRDLFLNNSRFANKQLIITSHSEEFIKDFENSFSKDQYEATVNKITLLNRTSKKIQKVESIAHYLKTANDCFLRSNKRDCLSNCRRALENVAERLWKKVANFENGRYNIEVKLVHRSPNRKPDLLVLLTGIRSAIKGIDNDTLEEIKVLIEWFEGLKVSYPRIWEYLNKGTHEETERDDFDSTIVKNILDNCILLDTKVKNKWTAKAA